MMKHRLFTDYDKLMMKVCFSDAVLEKFPTFPFIEAENNPLLYF